jgi:hypothetical protein
MENQINACRLYCVKEESIFDPLAVLRMIVWALLLTICRVCLGVQA